ncbi:MAG: hypothetical protein IH945_02055 [Armatimonadetes bacterium]|nr:hypothetical protein [Armatimonadota bacterium]
MAIRLDVEVESASSDKKLDRLNERLEAVARGQKALDKALKGSGTAAGQAASGFDRMATSAGRAARATKSAAKFTRGPSQRLLALEEQRARIASVSDPAKRAAIRADISRSEFLAKRSIALQAKRDKDPDALNRPGLLELFGTLNSKLGLLGGRGGRAVSGLAKMLAGAGAAGAGSKSNAVINMLTGAGAAAGTASVIAARTASAIAAGAPPIIAPPIIAGGVAAAGAGAGAGLAARAAGLGGPVGIAVGAAVAGLVLFTKALKFSIRAQRQIADEALAAGGTTSRGSLRAIAAATGTAGGSLASRVQGGLSSGAGLVLAARAGVSPISDPLVGDINAAEKVRKVSMLIRRQRRFESAQRLALAANAPELARINLLTPQNAAAALRRDPGISLNDQSNAFNLQAATGRIGNAAKGIAASAASPLALIAGGVAGSVARQAEFVQSKLTIGDATTKLRRAFGMVDFDAREKKVRDGVDRALDDNTKALRENTIMINGQRNFVGGAGRLRGAVPTSLRQERLDDFIDGQGVELGHL